MAYKNLFNKLHDLGLIPLESEMQEVIDAYKKDLDELKAKGTFRLKPKQKALMKDLTFANNRFIQVIDDHNLLRQCATLSDSDLNDFYEVPMYRVKSLIRRGLIARFEEVSTLSATITKYKPSLKTN